MTSKTGKHIVFGGNVPGAQPGETISSGLGTDRNIDEDDDELL